MEKNHAPPRRPIVIIPARMASTRLPGKPLAGIHGVPMIVHVLKRALESDIGPVAVACDGAEIANAVEKAGGKAVLTNPDHASGSDRIWQALKALEGESKGASYDAVINVQGDLPSIDPAAIRAAWEGLGDPQTDIATLAVAIKTEGEKTASQVVKAVIEFEEGKNHGRALYFSRRAVPWGDGPLYHHVGLYAYRRNALERFVTAPPSQLERREKLEQLRALALGLYIGVTVIDTVPLGVDTPEDLETARRLLSK
ncbi:MAG TPA: 3-deoxy-manno-octulosonate cytidylyltransferase [Alphaproteobacteria bacterium]|nr:3-deoxy-manno-octulosonate cytidylyltransferase [Alphaproteobacteria bacterium]